jgi:hypothetical protein
MAIFCAGAEFGGQPIQSQIVDIVVNAVQHEKGPNQQTGDTEKKELVEREFGHCRSLSIEAAPLHALSRK